jgi:hypothetical protein
MAFAADNTLLMVEDGEDGVYVDVMAVDPAGAAYRLRRSRREQNQGKCNQLLALSPKGKYFAVVHGSEMKIHRTNDGTMLVNTHFRILGPSSDSYEVEGLSFNHDGSEIDLPFIFDNIHLPAVVENPDWRQKVPTVDLPLSAE